MKLVLAGASGLIGTELVKSLRADGHELTTLVRHAPSGSGSGGAEVRWDPAEHFLEPSVLAGADAVVCLSGAGVGDHRWTDSYKQTIVDSRIDSLGTVSQAIVAAGDSAPKVLIAASAVGYYGDTGDARVTEDTAPGSDFLADACVQWEAVAAPARDAGVRVAHLRTGLVLGGGGGLLGPLVPIVKLGIAGKLGSGKQYMPWISLRDEVRAIRFLLEHDISGPVNLTGPRPMRNAEFMSALGKVLHRPTVVPTPGFALKLVLGEFAETVLGGQQAVPDVLTNAGFDFEHEDVESALRWALG